MPDAVLRTPATPPRPRRRSVARHGLAAATLLAAGLTLLACGDAPSGRAGYVIVHDGSGPNRMRLELHDDDLIGGGAQTAEVTIASVTDPTGIAITLTRIDDVFPRFESGDVRLTDPANGFWSASQAVERVLVAGAGEVVTATYHDADPAQATTDTRTWTASFELYVGSQLEAGLSLAGMFPPSTEDDAVLAHDYGPVALGATASLPVVIKNIGEAPVDLVDYGVTDHTLDGEPFPAPTPGDPPPPASFVPTVPVGEPVSLDPGEGFVGAIRFQPQVVGVIKGKAGVTVDGGGWRFWLVGTGQ